MDTRIASSPSRQIGMLDVLLCDKDLLIDNIVPFSLYLLKFFKCWNLKLSGTMPDFRHRAVLNSHFTFETACISL